MIKLYLDDIRTPVDKSWHIVRSYDEFVAFIDNLNSEQLSELFISFDHDLAEEHYTPSRYWNNYEASKEYQDSKTYKEKTGLDCARYLVNCDITIKGYTVHSMNPVGADNIIGLLDGFYKYKNQNIKGTKTFWEHTS